MAFSPSIDFALADRLIDPTTLQSGCVPMPVCYQLFSSQRLSDVLSTTRH
jgi:hypothetical protein